MHCTEKMERKDIPDSRGHHVFLVCQQINVDECQWGSLFGCHGSFRRLIMYVTVCVLIICTLWAPVWLSVWRVLTFVWGRREDGRGGEKKESSGSLRETNIWKKFKRMREALIKLLSEICVCVCQTEQGEQALPWQDIRCLAGADWPATCCPPTFISLFFYSISPLCQTKARKSVSIVVKLNKDTGWNTLP